MDISEDVKLKLLAGLPLRVDNVCKLYPLTLREIADMDYSKYQLYLSNLIAEPKDFLIDAQNENNKINTFEIIIYNFIFGEQDYKEIILNAFKLFLKEDVYFYADNEIAFFYIGKIEDKRIINIDVFNNIQKNLKIQNCISFIDEDENFGYNINTNNERSRKMLEKLRKAKQDLKKAKAKDAINVDFSDLISILASNSNLSIDEIFNLDIYRFQDQFNRMKIMEEYKVNIQSLLAGADPNKIKLKHFICKIDIDNNE